MISAWGSRVGEGFMDNRNYLNLKKNIAGLKQPHIFHSNYPNFTVAVIDCACALLSTRGKYFARP